MTFKSYEELAEFLAFWFDVRPHIFYCVESGQKKLKYDGTREQLVAAEKFMMNTKIRVFP